MAQSIEISTVQGLTNAIETLTLRINALDRAGQHLPRGSGVALQELRKIIIGVGKSGEGLSGLAGGLKDLGETMKSLNVTMGQATKQMMAVFDELPNKLAEALSKSKLAVRAGSTELVQEAAKGVKEGSKTLEQSLKDIRRSVSEATRYPEGSFSRYSMLSPDSEGKAYQAVLKQAADEQAEADKRYAALRADSLSRGKELIIKATKAEMAKESAALKEAQKAESARYSAVLKQMAADQKAEDLAYAALRKDSLSRGQTLIISATKTRMREDSRLLAQEYKTEAARYQATLKQMADLQAQEDAKYVALRKDSLSRGKDLIVKAAKDRIKAEADALKSAQISGSYSAWRGTGGMTSVQTAGPFSPLPANYFAAPKVPAAPAAPKASAPVSPFGNATQSAAFRKLGDDMGYAHSAARGLASGFDLLYLTWGKIIPLLGGASISYGIRKTFDVGSEVEYNIEFLRQMSSTSEEASAVVRESLRKINAESIFTITELSQAMVALGQAGKTPAESLQMIKPVSDLATAGMVDLKTAYQLVNQAQNLYGLSTKDTEKLVSQIVLTTQKGALNVEDLGSSFKYASESNTRFGQDIESTLALLGSLANAGLRGSTAGTSYVNFLRDIAGRSGPAIKALEDLRKKSGEALAVFNKDGTLKDAATIIPQLAAALSKLGGQEADQIINKLTSDRGGRTFFAELRNAPGDTEKLIAALKNVDTQLAANQAKGLMETTRGQLLQFKSNLENTLDEVFEVYSGGFNDFFRSLTAAVASDSFKSSLMAIVDGALSLGEAIKNNFGLITGLIQAFVALKVAAFSVNIMGTIGAGLAGLAPILTANVGSLFAQTAAMGASTTAMVANGRAAIATAIYQQNLAKGMTATTAAAGAQTAAMLATTGRSAMLAGAIGLLAHPITGVIVALGMLAAAWYSMSDSSQDASDDLTAKVLKNGNLNIEILDKEIRKLREREGLLGKQASPFAGVIAAASTERDDALAAARRAKELAAASPNFKTDAVAKTIAAARKAEANVAALYDKQSKYELDLSRDKAKRAAEEEAKNRASQARLMREANANNPNGVGGGGAGGGKPSTVDQNAQALKRFAVEFERISGKAQQLTAAESKLQEMLESDAYKSATGDVQKLYLAKGMAAIAAEEDAAALATEYKRRYELSEILSSNAQHYNDLLNAKKEEAYGSQVRLNGLKLEIDLLKEKYALEDQMAAFGGGAFGSYQSAVLAMEAELGKRYADMRKELNSSFSDVAGLSRSSLSPDKTARYDDWASQTGQLTDAQIAETALRQGKLYKDAWSGATAELSKTFVDQMMEGTLDLKDFLIDSFANMVLRPQLELATQQGMNALLGFGLNLLGLPSFAGGGDTGSGPRSGGLDGQGGFLAMVHPNETVMDRHYGQTAAQAAPVYVTINQTVGDVATKSMLAEVQQATVQQVQAGVSRSMRYRGGLANG